LTGAVRVALGQLSQTTQVRLRVPPAELALWTEAIALVPNLTVKPTVIAGEGMRLGDCVMETELGSVDLGIRSQLGEIERGFFDRAGSSSSGAAQLLSADSSAVEECRA
jgi:flagellar assembly protein FliH